MHSVPGLKKKYSIQSGNTGFSNKSGEKKSTQETAKKRGNGQDFPGIWGFGIENDTTFGIVYLTNKTEKEVSHDDCTLEL
jgi:hypothetical protein